MLASSNLYKAKDTVHWEVWGGGGAEGNEIAEIICRYTPATQVYQSTNRFFSGSPLQNFSVLHFAEFEMRVKNILFSRANGNSLSSNICRLGALIKAACWYARLARVSRLTLINDCQFIVERERA